MSLLVCVIGTSHCLPCWCSAVMEIAGLLVIARGPGQGHGCIRLLHGGRIPLDRCQGNDRMKQPMNLTFINTLVNQSMLS